jgi:hypothetical protein
MKIGCDCGATIVDQTDDLPHKAHLVPDQSWFTLLDAMDEQVIEPLAEGRLDEAAASHRSRTIIGNLARAMYQCTACGRLYLSDPAGSLQCFVPSTPGTDREVLRGWDARP